MDLARFHEAKQAEIKALLCAEVLPQPYTGFRPDFREALKKGAHNGLPAVIAEYKRASPSRGVICESLSPEETASQYAQAGASAMSVLTERQYFHGDIAFLERISSHFSKTGALIPLLRKDFILHPVQIAATIATPASALLLIVRLTPDVRLLRSLREQAERGGVQCVTEVFNQQDLNLARESGADIIQVNARDLETLHVDRTACLKLIQSCPPERGELWIAASGMRSNQDLRDAADAGYDAALVGSSLMEKGMPGISLRRMLRQEDRDAC